MNFLGNTFVALADEGSLFSLDYQLVLNALITAFNVFVLYVVLSYVLFNPVKKMLKKRQDKITSDRETAEADKKSALELKLEYEEKLNQVEKEADAILSEARKTAMQNEQRILEEAKQEAARIIDKANTEAELEKQKCADEVKLQIVAVAHLMASKMIARSLDAPDSDALIEQTLNEMGENTWLS